MLKSQLSSTCHTFLPDAGNNGNVMVLMKGFHHGPLNVVQIVVVRHKPFSFLHIAFLFNSTLFFFFQNDKDAFILDVSPKLSKKRQRKWDDNSCDYKSHFTLLWSFSLSQTHGGEKTIWGITSQQGKCCFRAAHPQGREKGQRWSCAVPLICRQGSVV